ncbi:hypothetical protein FHG87_017050 [Trinorchestia longiramus]|nr:hypothetical protein FHG87_017050 [Trinorchestia longiramus]
MWIVAKVVKWQAKIWTLEKVGGPKALPVLGHTLDIMGPPDKFLEALVKLTNDGRSMTRIYLSTFRPYVVLKKAGSVEGGVSWRPQKYLPTVAVKLEAKEKTQ